MHTFLSSGRTVSVAFPLENCSVRLTFPAQVANSSRGTLVVTNRQIIVLKLIKRHQYITNIILCQYYTFRHLHVYVSLSMGSVLKSAGEPSSEKPEAAIGPNRVFRLLTDASLVQLNFLLCFVPYSVPVI